MTQYKVLVDGRAAHGGDLAWSLPREDGAGGWEPGEWHRVEPPIVVCERGLHLTTDPMQWPKVGMAVYAAEGRGASQTEGDKTAFAEARLLRPAPEVIPDYWRAVERFVTEELPAVPWFQPDGNPDPAWRVFTAPTVVAAGAAARVAARGASWDAARDAGFYTLVAHVCADLPLEERHRAHARERWAAWQKGYGVATDVDGVLYVYAKEG